MERWKKEYKDSQNKIEPLLRCVSVDSFEEPCFVVEDRPGLFEEYGTDPIHVSNGVTLVKPREKFLAKRIPLRKMKKFEKKTIQWNKINYII